MSISEKDNWMRAFALGFTFEEKNLEDMIFLNDMFKNNIILSGFNTGKFAAKERLLSSSQAIKPHPNMLINHQKTGK